MKSLRAVLASAVTLAALVATPSPAQAAKKPIEWSEFKQNRVAEVLPVNRREVVDDILPKLLPIVLDDAREKYREWQRAWDNHLENKRAAEAAAISQPTISEPQVDSSAPVATGDIWYQLALCESGANPATNTGNGYYGAFQFVLSTWQSVGGTGYPHEHSYATQLHFAQILQARSGWGQWPACAASLGLI